MITIGLHLSSTFLQIEILLSELIEYSNFLVQYESKRGVYE